MKVDIDETGMLVVISESGAEDSALGAWLKSGLGTAVQPYFQDMETIGASPERKRPGGCNW